MISFIRKIYSSYLLSKVKKLYANKSYDKALKIIDKINFKNKAYFHIMKGMLYFYNNNLDNSKTELSKGLKDLDKENIFNYDEKNYLKSYVYYSLALVLKELKQKENSIEMIKLYNEYKVFNRDNIREHLKYDFPLDG